MDENFVTEDVIEIPEGLELFGEDDYEEPEAVPEQEETPEERAETITIEDLFTAKE